MVEAASFPRRMRRGVFKGQRFDSAAEYAAAIHALRGNGHRMEPEAVDEGELSLVVKIGGLTLTLNGSVDERGLTAVLDALGELDAIHRRTNGPRARARRPKPHRSEPPMT